MTEEDRAWWEAGKDPKSLQFELYKLAVQTRAQEIDRLWQRSNYFLVLNSGMAAGLLALKGGSVIEILYAAIGFVVATLWFLVNAGGKFWHIRWEYKTRAIERAIAPEAKMLAARRGVNESDVNACFKEDDNREDGHKQAWWLFDWIRWRYRKLVMTRNKPSVSESLTILSIIFMGFWVFAFFYAIWEWNNPLASPPMQFPR